MCLLTVKNAWNLIDPRVRRVDIANFAFSLSTMARSVPTKADWDPWKLMNVTKEELDAVEQRRKMRDELKAKWQRMATNPHSGGKGGHQLDPAFQRWLSARSTAVDHFKVTSKTIPPFLFAFVLPVAGLTYLLIKEKEEQTRKIRSGELNARNRNFRMHY